MQAPQDERSTGRAGPPAREHQADKRTSRALTWLLRHGADREGIPMDAAGWVPLQVALDWLGIGADELSRWVCTDSKCRFELDGGRIRAAQGHSHALRALRLEALERSWTVYAGQDSIWHGTSIAAVSGIADAGISPGERTHVHCSLSIESHVGKRAGVDLLLEISPVRLRAAGLRIFVSANEVALVRHVPADTIMELLPRTRRARRQEEQLRALISSASRVKSIPGGL